ncbi:hypothetical protein JTB14_001298 [Gonioctena quinquepunctata]|nr:hypothetical protein JTB14_001298 [Gonioctena quinquepunctata]
MTSKEFEELLDDAYVDSLTSDNESVDSDVIDSDERNYDEEIAIEMLLMDSEGEFQQEDSEDDMPLSMLKKQEGRLKCTSIGDKKIETLCTKRHSLDLNDASPNALQEGGVLYVAQRFIQCVPIGSAPHAKFLFV